MNGQFDLGQLKPGYYFLTIAVVLGLVFAFIVPDDDVANGWWFHIAQWQIQTVLPMFLAVLIHGIIFHFRLGMNNPWAKLLLSGVLAAIVFTPVALLSDIVLANEEITNDIYAELMDEFLAVTPPIIILWIVINAPFQLGWQITRKPEDLTKTVSAPLEFKDGFFTLLPSNVHGEILYIKSELHYLLVVTHQGKALILYSLRNAIAELSHIDGAQPHRSYWVNFSQISRVEKKGREGLIHMSDKTTIPISRSKLVSFIKMTDSILGIRPQ